MVQLYSLIVGRDPRQYGFEVALWTRKLVGDLIFQKFQMRLSLPTVGRILKKLGMSPQPPLYRAYQQDRERVRVWKQQTYPKIKVAAAQAGATIFFAEKAGVRTRERKSVNMVSAVSPGGLIHFDGSRAV